MPPRAQSRGVVAPAAGSGGGDELPIDVDLIKVLASDTRRDILRLLGERRRTLTELAEALDLKKATILEHLKKLVEAGLIRRLDEDERLWIYYELTPRGRRLVHPGRTRFYLIMAGAVVATLLVGALAVVALANLGAFSPGPGGEEQAQKALMDGDARAVVPDVVWRGLDDAVPLSIAQPARVDGELRVHDGASVRLALQAQEGVAVLRGEDIDALPPGDYALRIAVGDVEATLPQVLRVRDPAIAVFPRAIPAGADASLAVTIAPDATRPPSPPQVQLDGRAVALAGASPRYQLAVGDLAPGDHEVSVGRLASFPIEIVPDLRIGGRVVDGQLHLRATNASGPLAGVALRVDGVEAGVTNATGEIAFPAPAAGEHVVVARTPIPVELRLATRDDGSLVAVAPRLALSAFPATSPSVATSRVHVELRNADPGVNETVTLVLRDARGILATHLVDAPAGGAVQVALDAAVAPAGPMDVEAYAVRSGATLVPSDNGTLAGENASASPPEPAAAPTPAATAPGAPMSDASQRGGRAPDARVTVTPIAPTSASGYDQTAEPQVPGPGLALALVAIALAALAARRLNRS